VAPNRCDATPELGAEAKSGDLRSGRRAGSRDPRPARSSADSVRVATPALGVSLMTPHSAAPALGAVS
jgi:hypothetical protein